MYLEDKDYDNLKSFVQSVYSEFGAANEDMFRKWADEEMDMLSTENNLWRTCILNSIDFDHWCEETEEYMRSNPAPEPLFQKEYPPKRKTRYCPVAQEVKDSLPPAKRPAAEASQ